jgi:hypothetical protein
VNDFFRRIPLFSRALEWRKMKKVTVSGDFPLLVAGTLRISNLFPDYYRIIFTHDFLFEELIKTSNV